uniref:Signal-regulatory protein beta-2 n=1 Tax=Larimichthys crocea TaxID=215358 RepID=A0A0F8CKD3_LARCR
MIGYFVNLFLLSHFCEYQTKSTCGIFSCASSHTKLILDRLCISGAAQFGEIFQPVPFQTVKLGDSVTIKCHIKSEINKRVWYKLTTGKRLQLVVAFNTRYNRSVFDDEFHRHYSVKFDRINSHLRISATTQDIVGTYFCGVLYLNEIKFGSGTFLMIKGANMISDSVVQQPETQSVQPGGSVTLNCSVRIVHCAAEHTSVTWLKSSHHSAPQMIYSSGIKNHTCQSSESGETTCLFNFLMKNLSSDDAGTCYCVVSSCGQTLFGNGTRIHVHSKTANECNPIIRQKHLCCKTAD